MEIQFQNVAFRYESRKNEPSVSDLNFTINSGEFILLCGASGSGKSTVGRIINGLVPGFYRGELTGTVLLDGTDITSIPQVELAGLIGSVFQNPRTQFFDTNSTGELAFGCENMGFPPEQIHERIRTVTKTFGLESLLDRDIFELSGGEKQKIACGSIYAVDPDVYVFDEPSSNLDFESIKELAKIMGATGTISRKKRLQDSYLVMQDVNHQLFSESVEGELLMSDPNLTKEQIAAYLADLDLTEFADDHPMALSGGQRQRVAVAAACAAKKKYLYLDEPTSGLDYTQMKNMSKTIRKIKEKVSYVLIVTHDPEFIVECCDHVIELEKGSVKRSYPLNSAGDDGIIVSS